MQNGCSSRLCRAAPGNPGPKNFGVASRPPEAANNWCAQINCTMPKKKPGTTGHQAFEVVGRIYYFCPTFNFRGELSFRSFAFNPWVAAGEPAGVEKVLTMHSVVGSRVSLSMPNTIIA